MTTRDWLVPVSNIIVYKQIVTAAGCERMFRYELFDLYGHNYTYEDMLNGFNELITWVESLE